MIYEYLVSFALAFIVVFLLTPIVKNISFKIGAIDIPKDNRRMHNRPVARLGGLAIAIGFFATIIFNVIGISKLHNSLWDISINRQLIGLLIGVIIIISIGIYDDIKGLNAKYKFVFQLLAALLTVIISGTKIEAITNPFSDSGISILSNYISYPLTILWIIGVTNAINLIDGLDGLAAGVSSISCISLFFISMMAGDFNTSILLVILVGVTLGFLPYNFNPAKIFMGDTGSTFLGFTIGVISIQGTLKSFAAISVTIPILALGLPLLDTAFAIIRRVFSGNPIMQPDKKHLHHRLIEMGLSQRQSVIVMYTASAVLGLCAILLTDKGVLSTIILAIAASILLIGGSKYMIFGKHQLVERNEESIEKETVEKTVEKIS